MTNNRGGGGGASNVLTNSKQAIAASNANTSTSADTMNGVKPKVHDQHSIITFATMPS
jgi:hypothetical protein